VELFLENEIQGIRDLPWDHPLSDWGEFSQNLLDVPMGSSHHPVVFANIAGTLFALKEMPGNLAEYEFQNLKQLQNRRIPAVSPAGFARIFRKETAMSVLISEHLNYSLPFIMLFESPGLNRYKESLLDAIANLLVQLHLAGVYWGDCSLSNALFRRDAGALQAYLVDAESVQLFDSRLQPESRSLDIENMTDNINRELAEIRTTNLLTHSIPLVRTTDYIRVKYQKLWEELTKEEVINEDERFRIQDRIQAINHLGYSVGEINLNSSQTGSFVKFQVFVTDRNFHRDQLFALTGLDAHEKQAEIMINEIIEVRASLSSIQSREIPMTAAAYYWLEKFYMPVINRIPEVNMSSFEPSELYCQILEHKWFLSERQNRDVGHMVATDNYLVHLSENNK